MISLFAGSHRAAGAAAAAVLPAMLAILLGAFLIYGVGFAGSEMVHNAAHDSRHAFTFPCH